MSTMIILQAACACYLFFASSLLNTYTISAFLLYKFTPFILAFFLAGFTLAKYMGWPVPA